MAEDSDVTTVERVIAAPPEKIFEILADPTRHSEIDGSGSVRDAKETPDRLAVGATFGMNMKLGVPYSMVNEVIEYDDNKRIAWQTRPSSSWQHRFFGGRIWRYELEPVEGGTQVRETWDVAQEKGPIKYLLRTGLSRRHTRTAMDKTLANIATIVE